MALSHIAFSEEAGVVNTKQIAELYDIPGELLAKILQRLAKNGLIVSQNGPKGGYALAKSPAQITVGEVIAAIEGPIGLTGCQKGADCEQIFKCSVRAPIQKIQERITQLLESITIEQITRPH